MGLFTSLFNKIMKEKDFPPKPAWKPDLPIDIDLIVDKTKFYTSEKLQFAVFQYGTVAFFAERVENIEESAKIALDRIYHAHPDFNPLFMDDGNYLVQYSQPAFTIIFAEEIKDHWNYIEKNHMDGICRDEVLINANGQHNVFDDIGKIGLWGRAKMFMDAREPRVLRIFDPTELTAEKNCHHP